LASFLTIATTISSVAVQGGDIANQPGLTEAEAEVVADKRNRGPVDHPHPDDLSMAKRISEKVKAAIMLSGVDLNHHKRLKEHCEDSFIMGRDEFPNITTELLMMVNNFC